MFTWHIHGSYLYYLSQGPYDIYIPVNGQKTEGYYGRGETFPFGSNVIEIDVASIKDMAFDCILYQTNANYLVDQYEILTEAQRKLPRIYLEHDPPRKHPTDTRHVMDNPEVIFVHVTEFNRLMWDNGDVNTSVIEHGVMPSAIPYSGELDTGIVVINNLPIRGRLLGLDLFLKASDALPLHLVGMGTGELGLGEVLHPVLPEFISRYRFFFNPIRYTSLGLAVCEAMMSGMPIVAMATTEMVTVIENGKNGFIHTDINYLIDKMKLLITDRQLAKSMGTEARKTAEKRFAISRFVNEWHQLFMHAVNQRNLFVRHDIPVLN